MTTLREELEALADNGTTLEVREVRRALALALALAAANLALEAAARECESERMAEFPGDHRAAGYNASSARCAAAIRAMRVE